MKPKQKPTVFQKVGVGSVNYVLRHTEVEVIAIFVSYLFIVRHCAGFKFHPTRG